MVLCEDQSPSSSIRQLFCETAASASEESSFVVVFTLFLSNATENYLRFCVAEVLFFSSLECYFDLGDYVCGCSPLPNMAFLRTCHDINTS